MGDLGGSDPIPEAPCRVRHPPGPEPQPLADHQLLTSCRLCSSLPCHQGIPKALWGEGRCPYWKLPLLPEKPALYKPPVSTLPHWYNQSGALCLVASQVGIQGQQQVLDEILENVGFLQPHHIPAGANPMFSQHTIHGGAL